MKTVRSKVLLGGLLAACVFGGVALQSVWATPAAGVTSTALAGPVVLDEMNIKVETDTHELELKTKGEWESRVVHFRIVPGGHFGWHSHPGPVFVMITSGTLTLYHADDPTTPINYPAGTGFVDHGDVHIAGNAAQEGDVQVVAFFLTPKGAPIRIDEPAP